MPVLRQPKYLPQPLPWDQTKAESQSLAIKLPINETERDERQKPKDEYADLQKAKKEGYEAGYKDGLLAGQREGYRQGMVEAERNFREQQLKQLQYFQHLLNKVAEAIRSELTAFFSRAEEAVTELALEIARKVVEVEVKTNPEIVKKAVYQALDELKGGNITVRLNPEDFSLFGDDLSLVNLGEGFSVRFVPDESVERGGVFAESENGFVDLQPSTKLALLQSEVL
ncbi:MAG: FliH/SctL family protein [Armatimonadetes bacterium]|nr:FliH/SctL family protein [Armatimonadota bacterium]MDW8027475.1 FliH/SctL family protein [Armatimonadota bacterium]